MVNKCATKEDVEDYFEQIDEIADRYLGRDHLSIIIRHMILCWSWKKS